MTRWVNTNLVDSTDPTPAPHTAFLAPWVDRHGCHWGRSGSRRRRSRNRSAHRSCLARSRICHRRSRRSPLPGTAQPHSVHPRYESGRRSTACVSLASGHPCTRRGGRSPPCHEPGHDPAAETGHHSPPAGAAAHRLRHRIELLGVHRCIPFSIFIVRERRAESDLTPHAARSTWSAPTPPPAQQRRPAR